MNLIPLVDATGSLQAALLCVRGAGTHLQDAGQKKLAGELTDIKVRLLGVIQRITVIQDEAIYTAAGGSKERKP